MAWMYCAGITNLKQVSLDDILAKHKLALPQQLSIILPAKSIKDVIIAWRQCHSYYMDMIMISSTWNFYFHAVIAIYSYPMVGLLLQSI